MNKHEAKMKIFNKLSEMDMPADDFVEMTHMIDTTVDAIEPEHKKVVLPKSVGDQWDKLVCGEEDSGKATKVDNALYHLSHNAHILDTQLLFNWWRNTPGSYSVLINASKYGWVDKPDKRYRVKVYGIDLPGLFYRKRDDGTLTFVQGGAGLPETEFTMGEIKHRHLENCEREEVIGNDMGC
ncbi:hypothetical protein FMM01_13515 [Schleiferilactobacillus harbinensis]|uniref:hypothetical protein n=1 Tax=Schleiferilactobacillus harbinensis TaxID=304207 RepID=UPI00123C65BA|nr:hypothetical protein [Schleiferilactobacillus harbinensis]QEU48244.1 hypothetical protein FMM01_13515 [Schleiferilactobacillus harbinensis]